MQLARSFKAITSLHFATYITTTCVEAAGTPVDFK